MDVLVAEAVKEQERAHHPRGEILPHSATGTPDIRIVSTPTTSAGTGASRYASRAGRGFASCLSKVIDGF